MENLESTVTISVAVLIASGLTLFLYILGEVIATFRMKRKSIAENTLSNAKLGYDVKYIKDNLEKTILDNHVKEEKIMKTFEAIIQKVEKLAESVLLLNSFKENAEKRVCKLEGKVEKLEKRASKLENNRGRN